jgi:hypothetical protein
VLAQDLLPQVREMYSQSLSFAKFDREYRNFWQVPDSFQFSAE